MKKVFDQRILFNALKVASGCVAAIFICTMMNLQFSATAGLITVLSIQNTKKETIFTALKRIAAFFAAVIISAVCFSTVGYNTIAFGIYLFFFIIFCNIAKFQSAIVPVSVLITHILTLEKISYSVLLNEFLLLFIGAGIGILINMHLHKDVQKMRERKNRVDNEIKAILRRMSDRILEEDKTDYNAECFRRIEKYINEAEEIARSNNENSLFASENYNVMYLKMRREQCSALYDMYCYVKQMNITPKQAVIISDFLRKISEEYDESNTVSSLIEEADKIFEIMKLENLPEKREEFENRAILYSLLLKTREFLHIKYIFITRQLN